MMIDKEVFALAKEVGLPKAMYDSEGWRNMLAIFAVAVLKRSARTEALPKEPTPAILEAMHAAFMGTPDLIASDGWHATDLHAAYGNAYRAIVSAVSQQREKP